MNKSLICNTALVVGTSFLATSAFATGNDITAAINSAVDAAKANMTLVTVGVLTVAAIGFGIGLVVGFLRK